MISKTPFPFVIVFLLGVVLTAFGMNSLYKERRDFDAQQILAYKERLGEIPSGTAYTKLTKRDLYRKAILTVRRLREFQEQTQAASRRLETGPRSYTQEEWEQTTQAYSQLNLQREIKFQKEFLAEVRALQEELLVRLPPPRLPHKEGDPLAQAREMREQFMVQTSIDTGLLAGPDPLGGVANYLENLANRLPMWSTSPFFLPWQDTLFTIAVITLLILTLLRQVVRYRKERT